MKLRVLTIITTIAALLVAAAVGGASATEAAPKPGLLPGKWHGTGTLKGTITDDAATTTFTGKIGFRLTVRKDLSVKGTGSWVRTMKGRGVVSSTMTGIGVLMPIAGTSTAVRFGYTEMVNGTVTANGIRSPVEFERIGDELEGRLVITRAGKCSAKGIVPMGEGPPFTWTAKRLGKCTA